MGKGKYNRRNFLLRVADIQEIYKQYHGRGYTDVHIYQTKIYPTYKIGRTTFYNYLAISPMMELKKLEEKMRLEKEAESKQLKMFMPNDSDR